MSNERLRAAITGRGHTVTALAEHLSVDRKTVERWVTTDRVPHRTHRLAAAAFLSEDDVFLWPSTAADAQTTSASAAEFVTLYPNRGSITIDTWVSLLDNAHEAIDLLAFAGSFLHDAIPDFADRLSAAARRGVAVRLLFGDPSSVAVRLRGDEEGIGELLAARCRLTWAYMHPILGEPGLLARQHGATVYASLFRFDSTLLVNTHTYGAAASHSPVLHLRRIAGGRLFSHHLHGFDRTWDTASPVKPEDGA